MRGIAPKSYLPTYREFYEKRHFAPGDALPAGVESIELPGVRGGADSTDGAGGTEPVARVPFGANLLFEVEDVPGLTFHVEVCEDMWVPVPPSSPRGAGRGDGPGQPLRLAHHGGAGRGP